MKIISGGQTGVDRTALEVARELGFPTGGCAPKNFMTENGPDPSLAEFGLRPHHHHGYPVRTQENVNNSDLTVWFGSTTSRGYQCTRNAAVRLDRPFFENPSVAELFLVLEHARPEVINIAGNRLSSNPSLPWTVRAVLVPVLSAFRELELTEAAWGKSAGDGISDR